ncbi:unnamed protein product [Urochloa humidicola]
MPSCCLACPTFSHSDHHPCRRLTPGTTMAVALLFLAMVASQSNTVVDSRFTWVDCQSSAAPSPSPSPSSFSSTNSTFWSNVVALLDALPSAAAAKGFASLSHGNGTDRAFVRGFCRGDTTPDHCATYLQNAALGIRRRCNSSRRAGIWYDDGSTAVTYPAPMFCFVSYADTNASTGYEDAYRQPYQNRAKFSDIGAWAYYTLISSLAARTINGSTSPPMFARGELVYDPNARNGTIYGLAQCMRDRTTADCDRCLRDSMEQLPTCCYGHKGGLVLGYNCYLRMEVYPFYNLALDAAPSSSNRQRPGKKGIVVILAVALPMGVALGVVAIILVVKYKRKSKESLTLRDNSDTEDDISYIELDQFNLPTLTAATNNFAKDNKLGEGGFGEVFKGILPDGEVIAVKRLSKHSSQGFHELKNELVLVAKLKHRNLVQLMGVCLKEEKLLVYEYMPNRSLDTILSDPVKRHQLDWSKRFMIICGIARGLLYLHEESRLKVIHRDLKPSNVLLDADMNPKISDFGLARAFIRDQSRDVTIRPVGTLGYMSPEYAYFGHVSNKSDMFSFGVIILEMVTGRRSNSMSGCPDSTPLLSYVWGKWKTDNATDVVDASLGSRGHYPEDEVLNCIQVGLLCVQENPEDRPDASTVVLMLNSPTTASNGGRRVPSRPAFFFGSDNSTADGASLIGSDEQTPTAPVSKNEVTISEFQPR